MEEGWKNEYINSKIASNLLLQVKEIQFLEWEIQTKIKKNILCYLIYLKYTDAQSLIKQFSLLKVSYKFEPKCITTDFDKS